MGKHRNFDDKDIFYASWTDAIQEFLSDYTQSLRLIKLSKTAVGVEPASGERISIGFHGPWRYRDEKYSLTISGSAGTKTIWAVAVTANDFTGAGNDPDETDYDFELRATTGAEPGEVAYSRKIGEVTWNGSEITAVIQTLDAVTGPMIESGALAGSGDIEWTRDTSGGWVPQLKAGSVNSAKLKPTEGIKIVQSDLTLKSSAQDLTFEGGNLSITPSVSSILRATLVLDIVFESSGVPVVGISQAIGYLTVDGEDEAAAVLNAALPPSGFGHRATVAQVYRIPLSAASHTIKVRAAALLQGEVTAKVLKGQSRLIYDLVAA